MSGARMRCCIFIGGIYSSVMPGMPPKCSIEVVEPLHGKGVDEGGGSVSGGARRQNIPRAMNILKFSGPELRVQLCRKKAIVRGKIARLLLPHKYT